MRRAGTVLLVDRERHLANSIPRPTPRTPAGRPMGRLSPRSVPGRDIQRLSSRRDRCRWSQGHAVLAGFRRGCGLFRGSGYLRHVRQCCQCGARCEEVMLAAKPVNQFRNQLAQLTRGQGGIGVKCLVLVRRVAAFEGEIQKTDFLDSARCR